MSFQSIFSAILALLMVHTLIRTVTGTPITASTVADTSSDPTRNTSLAWPTYLPGWGTITVSRDKLAEEYSVDILEQSGAWDAMPPIYNIHRPGPGACRNPYDFPDTDAVTGMICLPDGDDYNSMAKDVMTHHLGTMGCQGAWGCFCTCIVSCASKISMPALFSYRGFILLIKSSLKAL